MARPEEEQDPTDPFRLRDDPGWRLGRSGGRPDGLVALRLLFLQMIVALFGVGVIVGILASDPDRFGGRSRGVSALVVVAIGVLSLVAPRVVRMRLDCSDELALSRSYRARFMARLAMAEVPALAGFVAFTLTGAPWLYALGLVFTALGFASAGPMHANLVRDQEQLALDGCAVALVPALRRPVTRDTR
jgi:hypothetical protein